MLHSLSQLDNTMIDDYGKRQRHHASLGDLGNVGIGTTAPGAKLHVAGNAGTDGIMFPDGSIQTTSATRHILIVDEKAATTYAGSSSSTTWHTRDLNTKKIDTNNLATLSANQITLTAGTYYCQGSAPAHNPGQHKIRLRNVTDGVTVLVGTSEYSLPTSGVQASSRLFGQFTIAANKALEVQHYITVGRATDGLGTSTNGSGEVEAT